MIWRIFVEIYSEIPAVEFQVKSHEDKKKTSLLFCKILNITFPCKVTLRVCILLLNDVALILQRIFLKFMK